DLRHLPGGALLDPDAARAERLAVPAVGPLPPDLVHDVGRRGQPGAVPQAGPAEPAVRAVLGQPGRLPELEWARPALQGTPDRGASEGPAVRLDRRHHRAGGPALERVARR